MRTLRRLAVVVALLACGSAQAQLFRAYLATQGNDANACTLQAPCRLLPAALAAVASGGEIWILDSANFNSAPITIDKSVSIQAIPGVVGSLVAMGSTAAVTIGASGLDVSFRNISFSQIAGDAGNNSGIQLNGASRVAVSGCLFHSLSYEGIRVTGTGQLKVVDSQFRSTGGWGINAQNGARATVLRSQFLSNGNGGVFAYGTGSSSTTLVNITDSLISGGGNGVRAATIAIGSVARITVTRTTVDNNIIGVRADTDGANTGTASVSLAGSMVVNNAQGWGQFGSGSSLLTVGDNLIADNAGANTGVLTPLAPQ